MENILVLFGGKSVEHEISVITSLQIINKYKGKYKLIPIYLAKDNNFYLLKDELSLQSYKNFNYTKHKKDRIFFKPNHNSITIRFKKINFLAVYILTHGKNCEDGAIKAYFDTLNINSIGMSIYNGVLSQDKSISKLLSKAPQLKYVIIKENDLLYNMEAILKRITNIGFPLIVKPAKLGSSVGIYKINSTSDFIDKINILKALDDCYIVEKYLNSFVEYNIALFKLKNSFYFSEIEKIDNKGILSYKDKYENNEKSLVGVKKEFPAVIDENLKEEIKNIAKKVYCNLNSKYVCRIDFIYDNDNKKLYFNELNNIPGSLAYYLFEPCNLNVTKLVDIVIDQGLYEIDKIKNSEIYLNHNVFEKINIKNIKL